MIDFGFDPQEAVDAPRWSRNQPGQDSNYPHPGELVVSMESRFKADAIDALRRRGHSVKVTGELDGPCNVEAIRLDEISGIRIAGSDPRRDGWALAY
jgi:gamma-glutamyltranspeptidase/glutathione hydrolase